MLLFEDFEPDPTDGPTRRPLARLARRHLAADLRDLSAEAHLRACRTTDTALVEFLSRVVLALEQARVRLGDREP